MRKLYSEWTRRFAIALGRVRNVSRFHPRSTSSVGGWRRKRLKTQNTKKWTKLSKHKLTHKTCQMKSSKLFSLLNDFISVGLWHKFRFIKCHDMDEHEHSESEVEGKMKLLKTQQRENEQMKINKKVSLLLFSVIFLFIVWHISVWRISS